MTIRQNTIAKLQQLPESLLSEVSNFIDFVIHKHQVETVNNTIQHDIATSWEKWFEEVELLPLKPTESTSEYQQLLIEKYRQQGLEL